TPARRPDQPGNDVHEGGLAAAGPAEQRGQVALALEAHIEGEIALAVADIDGERHVAGAPWPTLRATCRASSSEAISAAIEIATEIRVRRIAPASPPGTWVNT